MNVPDLTYQHNQHNSQDVYRVIFRQNDGVGKAFSKMCSSLGQRNNKILTITTVYIYSP